MARPIRETPILFGEDGRRFEEKMKNAKYNLTDEEYSRMCESYEMVKKALERGEAKRKTELANTKRKGAVL